MFYHYLINDLIMHCVTDGSFRQFKTYIEVFKHNENI